MKQITFYLIILFSSFRMSIATGVGGGEDPPQTPGSAGSKATRGLTAGATSEKAVRGVEGAKVVGYDQIQQTFYQNVREKNKEI